MARSPYGLREPSRQGCRRTREHLDHALPSRRTRRRCTTLATGAGSHCAGPPAEERSLQDAGGALASIAQSGAAHRGPRCAGVLPASLLDWGERPAGAGLRRRNLACDAASCGWVVRDPNALWSAGILAGLVLVIRQPNWPFICGPSGLAVQRRRRPAACANVLAVTRCARVLRAALHCAMGTAYSRTSTCLSRSIVQRSRHGRRRSV